MRNWKYAISLPLMLLCVGCGNNADSKPTGDVKGKVSLDGSPLATGKIVFDEGEGVPAVELDIKDGAYSGKVTTGKKTVRILSYKAKPAPKGMTGGAYDKGVEENILPAKYNTASKEAREIKAGSNEFDFAVTSK